MKPKLIRYKDVEGAFVPETYLKEANKVFADHNRLQQDNERLRQKVSYRGMIINMQKLVIKELKDTNAKKDIQLDLKDRQIANKDKLLKDFEKQIKKERIKTIVVSVVAVALIVLIAL